MKVTLSLGSHARLAEDCARRVRAVWRPAERMPRDAALRTIRRMEAEFDRSDFIVVPSAVACASFGDPRYAGKARIIHAGIDHDFFRPPDARRPEEPFRVCYAGRVEIAKGAVYLLQAWKHLGLPRAELVMMGEVATEVVSCYETCPAVVVAPGRYG